MQRIGVGQMKKKPIYQFKECITGKRMTDDLQFGVEIDIALTEIVSMEFNEGRKPIRKGKLLDHSGIFICAYGEIYYHYFRLEKEEALKKFEEIVKIIEELKKIKGA
jgi:hypothetical protein